MKPFYFSKTLWVNFLVILAALLTYALEPQFPVQLSGYSLEIAVTVLAGVNFILRLVTKEKLTK